MFISLNIFNERGNSARVYKTGRYYEKYSSNYIKYLTVVTQTHKCIVFFIQGHPTIVLLCGMRAKNVRFLSTLLCCQNTRNIMILVKILERVQKSTSHCHYSMVQNKIAVFKYTQRWITCNPE